MAKDYYQILGLDKKASKDEIKRQFHKLAHKYHPDKQSGDEAKFKEINEAYQILSNDKKRSEYDMYGNVFSGGGRPSGGFDTSGFDFSNFTNASGFDFDLGDIFGEMFGGSRTKNRRGRDISVDTQIDFKEAIFGSKRSFLLNKIGECEVCHGQGSKPGTKLKTCTTCNGQGKVNETRRSIIGNVTVSAVCSTCQGRGEIPETPCSNCKGEGVKKQNEEINITIPAGIENGEMIRLSGKGEAVTGGLAGDLYIKIHVEPHKLWKRDGFDLKMDLAVKLTDALLGATYTITTLEGESLDVKIPAGISFGEILRIKNKGVPMGDNRRGNLMIKIIIKTPQKLSRKAKKLVEDLREEGV